MPLKRLARLGSLMGATGPAFTPVTQDVPFKPGSVLNFIKVPNTEVDLRIIFTALTEQGLWDSLKEAFPFFNPLNGEGYLQIQNPSGDLRKLQCTCITGLNLDQSTFNFTSVDAALTFFASTNPYWTSNAPNTQTFSPFNDGENTLLPPLLPIFINRGANDTIYEFEVENDGDVNASLIVLINGPATKPILTNLTIGGDPPNPLLIQQNGVLNMSANGGVTLGTGTLLTIDFLNKTITQEVVTPINKVNTLTSDSNFWPLLPGTNRIRLQILDASNQTTVEYKWHDTYSTMI
jgi:hypothetical protein